MPAQYMPPSVDWFALSPYLVMVAGALGMLVVGALTPRWPSGHRRHRGVVGRVHLG